MAQTKPKYMLIEHGRYFYQRKVPLDFQAAVGRKKWRAPLGDDFDAAYDRLKEIRAEHDTLIAKLKDPDERRDYKAAKRREREAKQSARIVAEEAAYDRWCGTNGVKTDQEEHQAFLEENGLEEIPVWEKAERWLEAFEHERNRRRSPSQGEIESVQGLLKRIARAAPEETTRIELPPYPEFKALVANASDTAKSIVTFASFVPEPMDDDEYHDRLVDVHESLFGDHVLPPSDPEERDLFDFAKMKLERRIARLARNPDTISKVAAKFYRFAQLRKKTKDKYERTIDRLIAAIGDIPVGQVTPRMLRDYRDLLKSRGLLPSSIRSEFTPIMGLFGYAVDEELIEISPMASVKLPKERRAVEEMKKLPFTVDEMVRIFNALDDVWGQPVRGLSDKRREALQMAVRVLAHTAMRPAEFMALRPDQVDEKAIRVEGGKTKSSWRVIPLHPNIADFPKWLHAGGLSAFQNRKTGQAQTDTVTVLRHNFARLIRDKMDEPITEKRKTLYSLRSTFQNAMRRAGAPKDVRRAILGHVESGAIRHYDDGPSFELLKKWVECTDPRV
jgi:integrase